MSMLRTIAWLIPFLFAVAAPAQDSIPQPNVVRETVADEDGMLQWVEWKVARCPHCVGTGKVECRHCRRVEDKSGCMCCAGTNAAPCPGCGGSGKTVDPLEKARCPSCLGVGVLSCHICGNKGHLTAKGSGGNAEKCASCGGDGGYRCTACGGAGLVDGPRLKPNVAKADLKSLRKAKEMAEQTLEQVRTFELDQDLRKSGKRFEAMFSKSKRYFPALKRDGELFAETMKHLQANRRWGHFPDAVSKTAQEFLVATRYYLIVQDQLLQLCIERLEANEATKEKRDK